MNFKNIFLCFTVLFLIFIMSGAVFADEAPAMSLVEEGTVSGDVAVHASNPFQPSGSLEYTIPDDVSQIRSANVIVSSYSGSGAPTYALYSNVTLDTGNGVEVLGYEDLRCDMDMAHDPTVYRINDHTTKQFSDYQSSYNITDKVKDLSSGDTIKISVQNTRNPDYQFDGRIKMIALVLAYDGGDDDKITYWLNVGQSWTQTTRSNLIKTKNFNGEYDEVTFENIATSSYSALCRINGKLIYDPIYEKQGSYFIDDIWDIKDNFKVGIDTNFSYKASQSGFGSFKSVVQLLKVSKYNITVNATITPQYKNTVYAGVINNLTVDVSSNKKIDVVVKLCEGKDVLYSENVTLSRGKTLMHFIDSKIRPITENTVNGNDNEKVNYTLVIEDAKGNIISETNSSFVLLYNGYFAKDLEYPNANPLLRKITVVGDVIVLNGDVYSAAGTTNRTDVFNLEFNGTVNTALLYVSYNWDKDVNGDFNTWNVTFNNVSIAPVASYRDQSNLGTSGRYGYGLIVFNVTDLAVSGENVFSFNKTAKICAVYPSSLIVLTDNDESSIKTVYILEESDLLYTKYNMGLPTGFNTSFEITDGNATLYVFAAGAQSGEGNIIVNGETYENVWNGTTNTFDMFKTDVNATDVEIYFEATGGSILGLHQMIVVEYENYLSVEVPEVVKYFKGSERLVVNVKDYYGNPASNRTVNITLNGVTYSRTTDENGSASMALGLNSGKYNVTADVDGFKTESSITILPTVNGTDVVKVFRNATQYYATFRDSEGNYLSNGTEVTFNINGVMYKRYINGNEGKARLNLNLEQGTYVITAINPVNGEMAANNITVIPRIVNNNDLVKYYRNGSQYYVSILGDDGKPVGANETVTFNINGVMYERKTNASGVARLNINLQPGEYVITAMYGGCNVANNITVLPVLTAENVTMSYKDGTKFKATLVDGEGNPLANTNVTFNINGVFYQRTTNATGVAALNINLMPGEYIITSSYNDANIANTIKING